MVESRVGDPRFLTGAREALADLRKMHGLDAPKTGTSLEETPVTYTVEWPISELPRRLLSAGVPEMLMLR